jgi:tetratricopeptide (TPR) repeat protein
MRILLAAMAALELSGCSSLKSVFVPDASNQEASGPINNPFGDHQAQQARRDPGQYMILRTKKGDRSVEVELPKSSQDMTDFVIPVSPAFKDTDRAPASESSYMQKRPGMADREIASTFPQSTPQDEGKRREVEQGLGLIPSEDDTPEQDRSYLAGIDHLKQLYRGGRFEAALIENDEMLRSYPTDPKLYEMRGTLLDRMGQNELAIRAWSQALRLNPNNQGLKRFIERRQPAAVAVPQAAAPRDGGTR